MRLVSTKNALAIMVGSLIGFPALAQAPPSIDWPTTGFDSSRTGDNPHETVITPSNVANLRQLWSVSIDGSATITEPIVAANIPTATGNHDLVIVSTEHGTTVALDAASGATIWSRGTGYHHVGCPDLPNGDYGISAPAAYDRPSNTVYAMGGDGKLYAYAAGTGATLAGWPVAITSDPSVEHVYGGLNVANHSVYLATASMCDSGTYHGRIVQVSTGMAKVVSRLYVDGSVADANGNITRAGTGGGGTFGAGGVTTDATGRVLYVATGNLNGAQDESSAYGNHIVRMLSDLSVLNAASPPLGCANCDLDFGSAPTLFQPVGCNPRLAARSKNRNVYIYRRNPFTNTALSELSNSSFVGELAYDTPTQELVSSNVDGVRAYKFNAACGVEVFWNTPEPSAPNGHLGGIVTPASIANGVVYYGNGSGQTLYALDLRSGKLLGQLYVGQTMFSQPTVVNGMMFVATLGGRVIALKP